MKYLALIGDMVNSRGIGNRRSVQGRFKQVCSELNKQYRQHGLVSPLTITLGDEFQALFTTADAVWPCVLALEAAMHPVEFRFALGIGELTTPVNRKAALEMDGPAFHRARDGIAKLKKRKSCYGVEGLNGESELVTCSLDLLSLQRRKWHYNRVAILADLLVERPVAEIQGRLDITEQAVYRNIRDGGLETVRCLLREVADLANRTLEGSK